MRVLEATKNSPFYSVNYRKEEGGIFGFYDWDFIGLKTKEFGTDDLGLAKKAVEFLLKKKDTKSASIFSTRDSLYFVRIFEKKKIDLLKEKKTNKILWSCGHFVETLGHAETFYHVCADCRAKEKLKLFLK